ncbi:MAG: aminopeptidase YwaD [Planctomycetota bacterium]|jgi:aminopeptidase YwaD
MLRLSTKAQPIALLALLGLALCGSCQSNRGIPSAEELASLMEEEPAVTSVSHHGPNVSFDGGGPMRFVGILYNGFRKERAMETVRFMDARVRTPGSEGFRQSLDEVERQLRDEGFGSIEGLELSVVETEMESPAWNARSAKLSLVTSKGGESVLHAFEHPSDPDRCLLPENAPSAAVSGNVAMNLADLSAGDILVTEASLRRDLLERAERKGAAAVISSALGRYNIDPTDAERHQDAIGFRSVSPESQFPVAQISPRSYAQISYASESGGASLVLNAEVELGSKTVRTLIATIVGSDRADEVVAMSSHLEAPGASDNATGAAGQLENALTIARVLERGGIDRPSRSIAFIWGMENEEADIWLRNQNRKPIAAVNAVMIGESRERTGAVPLLERYPDPGAIKTIEPDRHTLWGSRDIEPEWLVPNGLSIIARCALVDVSRHVGDWETFENPYEGGTDHERFILSGVPAVLFWHFTDFTFHTSLDREVMVDAEELKRMAIAALVTAMALADPEPGDLTRYLTTLSSERVLRIVAAEEAGEVEIAEDWRAWCSGVRHWLRIHCLGLQGADGILPGPLESAALKRDS